MPIGQGGMSTVFLATDAKLGRKVALKVLNNTQAHSQTLLEEARLLARLNHPNIVQVYNVQEIDDCLVLEMEYVQGTTLANHVKEAHISLEQKLSILIDIAQGLSAAHQQDILHLDLKAANVLINKQGQAKIADFGISQLKGEQELSALSSFGSLVSMSPEQLREEPLDQRSDLFSFGLLAYQLLTGNHPYRGQAKSSSEQAIAEQIKHVPLKASASEIIGLPPALIALLDRLLQFNKDLRPSSADEVAMQLKQVMMSVSYDNSDETVELNEVNISNPNSARNKLVALFSLAFLVIGLISAGVWYWQVNKPKTYIAALPIKYDVGTPLTEVQRYIVNLGFEDAISNFILKQGDVLQVSNNEVNNAIKVIGDGAPLVEIGKALGTDIFIEPTLTCHSSICEVTLRTLKAKDATVINSTRLSIDTESFTDVLSNIGIHLRDLFSSQHSTPQYSKNLYTDYLALYQQVNSGTQEIEKNAQTIRLLVRQAPEFLPLFTLYRQIAIEAHRQLADTSLLLDFLDVLEGAPSNYKSSNQFQKEKLLAFQELNDWKAAETLLNSLSESNMDEYDLNMLKANYYQYRANYSKSLTHISRAFHLRPTLRAMRNLAVIHVYNGNYPSALNYLNQLKEIAPRDIWALTTLADISLASGDPKKAIINYQNILALTPLNSTVLSNLSIAYQLEGNYKEAVFAARRAYSLNPKHISVALNLADSLMLYNEQDTAIDVYNNIIKMTESSDNIDDNLARAQALLHTGKGSSALKLIDKIKMQHTGIHDILFIEAMILTTLGEYQSALLTIQKSIEKGWSSHFYQLPWFSELCQYKSDLKEIINAEHVKTACTN
nr:serine/threonine-protein kinase [Pseudoalteromonas sp. S16_S37]